MTGSVLASTHGAEIETRGDTTAGTSLGVWWPYRASLEPLMPGDPFSEAVAARVRGCRLSMPNEDCGPIELSANRMRKGD